MKDAIELRELRLFAVLADELHFARTAERLHLTTSRVSQSLRSLEDKLGAQLVLRTSRKVRLTPLGEQLLRDVQPVLDQLDQVLARTADSAQSLQGTLRVGLLSGPAGGPRLLEILNVFESLHPECSVSVHQEAWDDPVGRLRKGEVDVMATWIPLEHSDLVVGPILTRQARVLAVAPDHPLASRESVDIEELADHPVARVGGWPKALREAVVPSATPGGRRISGPRIGAGEQALLDLPVRIARGEFVFPTVESAPAYMGGPDLAFIPIAGTKPLRSALVWRRPARDPKLRAFIDVAREILSKQRDSAGQGQP